MEGLEGVERSNMFGILGTYLPSALAGPQASLLTQEIGQDSERFTFIQKALRLATPDVQELGEFGPVSPP